MARMDSSRPRQSLVAAVSAVSPQDVAQFTAATGHRATYWKYYDSLPDIRYIVNLTGRLLSMASPQLEKLDETTGLWPVATSTPGAAAGALAVLHDSPGGIEDISRRFAQQYTMDGQDYIVGYEQKGATTIEALSTVELKADAGKFTRATGPNLSPRTLPARTKCVRVWRRHPMYAEYAETALEALTDDMETLIFLNASLRARVRSRLAAAGIVFIPNSITAVAPTETPDGTGQAIDPVTRKILEAMAAAINDPDSPDASMPIVLRGPDDVGEKIKHITLDRVIDEAEMQLRTELRQNILDGLDAPKGIGGGSGDDAPNVNHWNESSIKMEMWQHTVAPIGDVLWEALTQMVLTPWLRKKNVSGVYRWRVDRDSVQIRNNQDEKNRVALDRNLIGDKAARRRLGIPDTDRPSDEEYIRRIGQQMQIPELAFYKIDVEGIDVSKIQVSKTGPGPTGDGRDLPGDTPNDQPAQGDPRVR